MFILKFVNISRRMVYNIDDFIIGVFIVIMYIMEGGETFKIPIV